MLSFMWEKLGLCAGGGQDLIELGGFIYFGTNKLKMKIGNQGF